MKKTETREETLARKRNAIEQTLEATSACLPRRPVVAYRFLVRR
jgi:hypothetical protein